MKRENKSKYAILGMLFDKPLSGYELRKRMLSSTAHFWQESDASIYPMLKKLEQDKKVTSQDECTGKRKRTIFEITAAGKKEFLAWLTQPTTGEHRRSEFLLKMFFGAHANKKDLIKLFVVKQQELLESKKQFIEIERFLSTKDFVQNRNQPFWAITLQYGLQHVSSELEWIEESIKLLKRKG